MIKLGEKQTLTVVKKVEFGVYLSESVDTQDEKVLLPIKQVPDGTEVGDEIEVFVYRDSQDRLISTTKEPLLQMGRVAQLTVAQMSKYGAFLDWGLEKDLFLPFKEQRGRIDVGDEVLVTLYTDKSNRLCATMNVYPALGTDSPYQKGDTVVGRVYEMSDNFGAFVAVDSQYSGLIPKKEQYGEIVLGADVEAYVTEVRPDGKLNLAVRSRGLEQIEKDAEKLLSVLDSFEGALPFNDKAAPEVIKHETGMSKNQFKRAVGNLLKSGKIQITDRSIRRV